MNAEEYINYYWKENTLPKPIKEEWADLMEQYHQHKLKEQSEWVSDDIIKNDIDIESYAEFCIMCDRQELPILTYRDWKDKLTKQ